MSRYIDADVFMKNLKTNEHGDTDVNQVEIAIDKSRADVVEVVRCKDCKRGGWRVSGLDNKTKGYRCAIHAVLGFDFGDNGYCSYGERKEK